MNESPYYRGFLGVLVGKIRFMGIDENFNLDAVSDTIASEIIGQSVEVPLHEAWTNSIKEHINSAYCLLNQRLF